MKMTVRHTFRVFPLDMRGPVYQRTKYFTVIVLNTLKELHAFIDAQDHMMGVLSNVHGKTHYTALTRRWVYEQKAGHQVKWTGKEQGQILFCKPHLTAEIIAHECTHAAIGWWDQSYRSNIWPKVLGSKSVKRNHGRSPKSQEDFCYILGEMVAQVYEGIALVVRKVNTR